MQAIAFASGVKTKSVHAWPISKSNVVFCVLTSRLMMDSPAQNRSDLSSSQSKLTAPERLIVFSSCKVDAEKIDKTSPS